MNVTLLRLIDNDKRFNDAGVRYDEKSVRTIQVKTASAKYPGRSWQRHIADALPTSTKAKSCLRSHFSRDLGTLVEAFSGFVSEAGTTIRFVFARRRTTQAAGSHRTSGLELASAGADRSSLLIAFGGGIVGDMGGFLAAIYMRGIDYIQMPSTLLAQVDSSVGGKTGANLASGKNLDRQLSSSARGLRRHRPAPDSSGPRVACRTL